MSYLTEIKINAIDAFKLRLNDNYAWHKFIWKFFPNKAKRDFLFRVDSNDGIFRIYILSATQPTNIDVQNLTIRSKEVPESFLDREQYLFQIRISPVRKHVVRDPQTNERKKNGRRLTVPANEIASWLYEKFANAGMQILNDAEISDTKNSSFTKDKKTAHHPYVDVKGVVQIIDKEKFKQAFNEGLSTAKAFGFGMLILK